MMSHEFRLCLLLLWLLPITESDLMSNFHVLDNSNEAKLNAVKQIFVTADHLKSPYDQMVAEYKHVKIFSLLDRLFDTQIVEDRENVQNKAAGDFIVIAHLEEVKNLFEDVLNRLAISVHQVVEAQE